MALGLVGRKIGMTRLFSANGEGTPVTVLEVTANRVTQVKDEAKDGYRAVQLTIGSAAPTSCPSRWRASTPRPAWSRAAGCGNSAWLPTKAPTSSPAPRSSWISSRWASHVDVQGTSIGKGFAGTIKRHHFRGGRATTVTR